MVLASIFFFRVTYAIFDNSRDGPSGMTGMFGDRTEYLDGSIGVEIEAHVAIYGQELKSGIAYATASIDGRPIWMLQVDGVFRGGRRLELVSHAMDAGDTWTLLILEHSMNLLLKQFSTFAQQIPLTTIVDSYNNAARRTNADPDWKAMKLPALCVTNAAPRGMSAEYFVDAFHNNERTLSLQVNFGVPVEMFTPSRIITFLKSHIRSERKIRQKCKYLIAAVRMAGKWANAFFTKTGMRLSVEEKGILALTIAKTLGKQKTFGARYEEHVQEMDHIRALDRPEHTKYKNSLVILAKVNLRELISAVPADGALRRLLSDAEFLSGLPGEAPVVVADIQRLVHRNTLVPVDDDCFVDANRVYPPQRHSGGRLAIVMETRFPLEHSVKMGDGFLIEVRSSVEAVKRYQDLYGDLRAMSDLRPFQNFEVAIAITKVPKYSRVTLDFDGLDTGMIQKYVVPLAQDSQFLRSLRSVTGVCRIHFMNRAEMFAITGHVLSINVDSLNGGHDAVASDLCRALKSHIDQRYLNAGFKRISKLARTYNVQLPTEILSGHLDFDVLESLRSQFVEKALQRLKGIIRIGAFPTNIVDMWQNLHDQISRRNQPGFLVHESRSTPLNDDMRLTLDLWLDADSNMDLLNIHRGDREMMAKFALLTREMEYFRQNLACANM